MVWSSFLPQLCFLSSSNTFSLALGIGTTWIVIQICFARCWPLCWNPSPTLMAWHHPATSSEVYLGVTVSEVFLDPIFSHPYILKYRFYDHHKDNCHWKDSLFLEVLEKRACLATHGHAGAVRRQRGVREQCGQEPLLGSWWEEQDR